MAILAHDHVQTPISADSGTGVSRDADSASQEPSSAPAWLVSPTDSGNALAEAQSYEPAAATDPEAQSWALPVPNGAYVRIVAWNGSRRWFDALMDALSTPEGEALRARAKVKATTLLAIANEYRQYADYRTGRNVTVCHERIRKAIGKKSNKTIQRATRLLEGLGFAVTVVEGRYLTVGEREEAERTHGGKQRKPDQSSPSRSHLWITPPHKKRMSTYP